MSGNTRTNILHTENYHIDVDPQKNRIYGTIKGFINQIRDPAQVMEILHELKQYVSSGFTVLLDVTEQKVQTQEYAVLSRDFQEMVVEGGVSKIAEVLPDSTIVRGQHQRVAKLAGASDRHKVFTSKEDAEAWLDSPVTYS